MRITPSNILRNKAIAAGATEWLDSLPELVDALAGEWGQRRRSQAAGTAFRRLRERRDHRVGAGRRRWMRRVAPCHQWNVLQADRCDLDPVATWEWGVVERVSTGLLATSLDLQSFGRDMLAVSDALTFTAG